MTLSFRCNAQVFDTASYGDRPATELAQHPSRRLKPAYAAAERRCSRHPTVMLAPVADRPQPKGSALTSHAGRVFLQLLPLRSALLSRRRLRNAEPFPSQVHAVIHGEQLVSEPSVGQRYAVLPVRHARILHVCQRMSGRRACCNPSSGWDDRGLTVPMCMCTSERGDARCCSCCSSSQSAPTPPRSRWGDVAARPRLRSVRRAQCRRLTDQDRPCPRQTDGPWVNSQQQRPAWSPKAFQGRSDA